MRPLVSCILAISISVGLCPGIGLGQVTGISPEHHPWGSFDPEAWKLVRVITETLDDKGLVTSTSITETRTTLLQAEDDGVTLRIVACMEVAGKQLQAEPQTVKQGLHGEVVGQDLKIDDLGTAQVIVEGHKIPARVLQLESSGASSKTITKVYYSPTVTPHVLKRESATYDPTGENTLSETSVGVVAREMPYRVLAEVKSTSFIKAVQKHSKGTIITWAKTSTEVPGGIIAHSSKELDKTGRVIRRSTLELIDYGLEPAPERTGIFGRRRQPPRLRPPTRYVPR